MVKRAKKLNMTVDEEIISKGAGIIDDFNDSEGTLFYPEKISNKMISIRLPIDMIRALREVGRRRGDVGYQQIIKIYIADGLKQDLFSYSTNLQTNLIFQESAQTSNEGIMVRNEDF